MSRKREADFPTDTEQQRAAQRGAMGVELNWRMAAAAATAVQRGGSSHHRALERRVPQESKV